MLARALSDLYRTILMLSILELSVHIATRDVVNTSLLL